MVRGLLLKGSVLAFIKWRSMVDLVEGGRGPTNSNSN
jgi:hypothetical protein